MNPALAADGGGATLLCFLVLVYFIPAVVAYNRKHHNRAAIFLANLFLGWTFIGWVGALVCAVTDPRPRPIFNGASAGEDRRPCPIAAK